MIDLDALYTKTFMQYLCADSLQQAIVMGKCITEYFKPSTLIDIGCGSGDWVRVFLDNGVIAFGYDGSQYYNDVFVCPEDHFMRHDLRTPIPDERLLGRHVDIVMSLEVAEHIDVEYSDIFIDNIMKHDPSIIMFTSAPPTRPGHGHINMQPNAFWDDKIATYGYYYDNNDTHYIKQYYQDVVDGKRWSVDEVKAVIESMGLQQFIENRSGEDNIYSTHTIFLPDWFHPHVRIFRKY